MLKNSKISFLTTLYCISEAVSLSIAKINNQLKVNKQLTSPEILQFHF